MADIGRRLQRLRRRERIPRVFRDRKNPLEYLSRSEIRDRYRFFPESVIDLVRMVFNRLDTPTARSFPLPPLLSVLVTLMFYASNAHFIIIGDVHGVSKSSVCRAVKKTTAAVCSLMGQHIKFPSAAEFGEIQAEFYSIARFPRVIGVVDGTHIRIKSPTVNEPDYVNRKGFHSINVQVVSDASFKIRNVVAKWPGSVHDSRVFRESELCASLETGQISGILLGDSGYPCRQYLMTPYLNPQTAVQERYNEALVKTRVIVEQTFGVLKRRFPCLAYGLRVSPTYGCQITGACCVLHNFGIERGDLFGRATDVVEVPEVEIDYAGQAGARCRDIFAATYFS